MSKTKFFHNVGALGALNKKKVKGKKKEKELETIKKWAFSIEYTPAVLLYVEKKDIPLPAPGPPNTNTIVRGVESGIGMAAPPLTYWARDIPPGKKI